MNPVGSLNGARMREAREAAGLTLTQAKTELQVSWMYLDGIEDGNIPAGFDDEHLAEMVRYAAHLYGVKASWLWLGLDEW